MDEVFHFDKSLQERLHEYVEILSNDKVTSADSIRKAWSFYLELTIDLNGWQAVWKVPRLTCQELKIPFPSLILVYVDSVDFDELSAHIKVIGVQDDIEIHEHHFVPLMQLWPTKEQDKSVVLDLATTANVTDMYRFFYMHVFLPWDHDDDDTNWLSNNLSSRLRLYYDMKNGVIPRKTAEHIKTLLTEARRIQNHRENLQYEIAEKNIEIDDTNDPQVQELLSLNMEMVEIKSEMAFLENPVTRNIIINRSEKKNQKEDRVPQTWAVFPKGKLDDYTDFLQQLKQNDPEFNAEFIFSNSLCDVLENFHFHDMIILNKSRHIIKNTSGLECGGTLKGIYDKESTTLSTTNEDIMLDFRGDVLIENLTINASYSQCGILIRAGKTTLKNCKLHGDNKSSTHQGIIVLKGGQLEMENCEIAGFFTAIVGNSSSQIKLTNCDVYEANVGVKIYDLCSFNAANCKFRDCFDYGLCVETNSHIGDTKSSGGFKLLEV